MRMPQIGKLAPRKDKTQLKKNIGSIEKQMQIGLRHVQTGSQEQGFSRLWKIFLIVAVRARNETKWKKKKKKKKIMQEEISEMT